MRPLLNGVAAAWPLTDVKQYSNGFSLACNGQAMEPDRDKPQKDYFIQIEQGMPADTKIILCGPEPGLLYTEKTTARPLAPKLIEDPLVIKA
jgi:hypothetical protein